MDTNSWADRATYKTLGGQLSEDEFNNVVEHEPNWPTYQIATDLVTQLQKEITLPWPGIGSDGTVLIAKLLGALPYDHPVVSWEFHGMPPTRRFNEHGIVSESYLMRGLDPKPYEQATRDAAIAWMDDRFAQRHREQDRFFTAEK